MNKKTIKDIDLKEKKVLVRCDFNVPQDENLEITDNRRIVAALPTIKYLLENNCKVILCSHLGRPKGQVKKELSLAPVAKELSKLLGKVVKLASDIINDIKTYITEWVYWMDDEETLGKTEAKCRKEMLLNKCDELEKLITV